MRLNLGRAAPAEPRVRLDLDVLEARHRFQEPAPCEPLSSARLAGTVVVERDAAIEAGSERELRKLGDEKFGRMAHRERQPGLTDLVVEVDARGTPHHNFFR